MMLHFLPIAGLTNYWYLGRFKVSERRVLLTQWVEAWGAIGKNHKELIIRSFQKCGITVALDGSEDKDTNIRELDGYVVSSAANTSASSARAAGPESSNSDDPPYRKRIQC